MQHWAWNRVEAAERVSNTGWLNIDQASHVSGISGDQLRAWIDAGGNDGPKYYERRSQIEYHTDDLKMWMSKQ